MFSRYHHSIFVRILRITHRNCRRILVSLHPHILYTKSKQKVVVFLRACRHRARSQPRSWPLPGDMNKKAQGACANADLVASSPMPSHLLTLPFGPDLLSEVSPCRCIPCLGNVSKGGRQLKGGEMRGKQPKRGEVCRDEV